MHQGKRTNNSLVLAHTPGPAAAREIDYYDVEPEKRTHLVGPVSYPVEKEVVGHRHLVGGGGRHHSGHLYHDPHPRSHRHVCRSPRKIPAPPLAIWMPCLFLKWGRMPANSRKPSTTSSPAGESRAGSSRLLISRIPRSLRRSPAKYPDAPPEQLQSYMIDLFLDKLVVEVNSRTLTSCRWPINRKTGSCPRRPIDVLGREYVQLVIDSRAQSFALVKDWLFKQLRQITNKVQASQKKLFEFGQKHDFYSLEDKAMSSSTNISRWGTCSDQGSIRTPGQRGPVPPDQGKRSRCPPDCQ